MLTIPLKVINTTFEKYPTSDQANQKVEEVPVKEKQKKLTEEINELLSLRNYLLPLLMNGQVTIKD